MPPSDTQAAAAHRWSERWGLAGLILDLLMIALVIINLSWIVFDAAWSTAELRYLMGWVLPQDWLQNYAVVHEHFYRIDLIFVGIFLTEFSLRWFEAVWKRYYSFWFAYPILHWYDILGCIPVAGLRWLRILRVFAVLLRLQRLGLIDYTQWTLYRLGQRLYGILMEEISDRVVIRVLSGVQAEISASHKMEQQILAQVIAPRQQVIADALRSRLIHVGQRTYAAAREDLHQFITDTVSKAVHENREIKRIDKIPVVGGRAGKLLDHAITDIVCRVIDELSGRLSSAEFEVLFNEICGAILAAMVSAAEQSDGADQLTQAVNDMLELIKTQVAQRRWLDDFEAQPAASP